MIEQVLSKKQRNLEKIKQLSKMHLHGKKVYICPKCKKQVPHKSHKCIFCGEKCLFAVRVPLKLLKDVRNGIATKELHDYVHIYLFPQFNVSEQQYLEQYFTIILVQQTSQWYTGNINSGTFTITLPSTPTTGHILIATIGCFAGGNCPYITGITGNGTWAQAIGNKQTTDSEIWWVQVNSSPTTTITVTVAGGSGTPTGYEIAFAYEFSGLISSPVDKTNVNNGTASPLDSGTTSTTSKPSEVWIAMLFNVSTSSSDTQTLGSGYSAWTLNASGDYAIGSGYHESGGSAYIIVSSTGAAECQTTVANTSAWTGCVATFQASVTKGASHTNIGALKSMMGYATPFSKRFPRFAPRTLI